MHPSDNTRRRFLQLAVLGAAAAPLAQLYVAPARADDLPQLDEADATANALGYRHDTATVDKTKFPSHAPEQTCASCNLVQSPTGAWRPCAIFPGKAVNEKGWCAAWAKKA